MEKMHFKLININDKLKLTLSKTIFKFLNFLNTIIYINFFNSYPYLIVKPFPFIKVVTFTYSMKRGSMIYF